MNKLVLFCLFTALISFSLLLGCTEKTYFIENGESFGSIYTEDSNHTILIALPQTYYDFNFGLKTEKLHRMSFDLNKLQIKHDGNYLINWSMTVKASSNNQSIEGIIGVNKIPQQSSASNAEIINSNKTISIGGTTILSLRKDDLVGFMVENELNTASIIVTHANMSILEID